MSKRIAEESSRLDIRWLARNGYIPGVEGDIESGPVYWTRNGGERGNAGSIGVQGFYTRLVLTYSWKRDKSEGGPRDIQQEISLDRTPMPHGGQRIWAVCPYCPRRAAVLYLGMLGEPRFCCRRCAGVCYASQLERSNGFSDIFRDPFRGLERTAWGRKIIAQAEAEMSKEREQRKKELKKTLADLPKRPRGRPRSKRKYVRRSLVTPAADVPACPLYASDSSELGIFGSKRKHFSLIACFRLRGGAAHKQSANSANSPSIMSAE